MPLTRLETSLFSKTATGMSRSGELVEQKHNKYNVFVVFTQMQRYKYNNYNANAERSR